MIKNFIKRKEPNNDPYSSFYIDYLKFGIVVAVIYSVGYGVFKLLENLF